MERDIESGRLLELQDPEPITSTFTSRNIFLIFVLVTLFVLINLVFFRIAAVLSREKPSSISKRPKPSLQNPTHLLVVLGSGGHTAEMLTMLRRLPSLSTQYTHRTYVVSSGDSFSAQKAAEFEQSLERQPGYTGAYDIVTINRARRVHQSIFTTPWSALWCLSDCLKVLQGTHPQQQLSKTGYPDLILINGPGTAVCIVFAAIILLCFGLSGPKEDNAADKPFHNSGQMRTIFIESWARVKTLSLSGTLLLPLVDRFLVQWPGAVDGGSRAEYVGALVA